MKDEINHCIICNSTLFITNFSKTCPKYHVRASAYSGKLDWIDFYLSEDQYVCFDFIRNNTQVRLTKDCSYTTLDGIINFPRSKNDLIQLFEAIKRNKFLL